MANKIENRFVAILFMSFIVNPVYSCGDSKFVESVLKQNSDLLCQSDGAYLECLGVSETVCRTTLVSGSKDCLNNIDANIPDLNDEVDWGEVKRFGEAYMQCNVDNQLKLLEQDRLEFEKCLASDE